MRVGEREEDGRPVSQQSEGRSSRWKIKTPGSISLLHLRHTPHTQPVLLTSRHLPISKILHFNAPFVATLSIPPEHDKHIRLSMSNPQATLQRHALNRISTFMVAIFTLITRVVDSRVLLRKETVGNELHLFFCHKEDFGDQFVAQETGYTSIEAEEAMESHNYCVFVCKVFAGMLAWLIEGAPSSSRIQ